MRLDLITGHELIVQHATTYTGAMRRAISSFKDRENLTTLPLFITALAQLAQILPADGVLLPMPTTNTRLKERGFAPVMLLSRYLATLTGLPIYQGLVRVQDTLHQRGLSRLDRLHNVANAFAVAYDSPADKIIIIDDVCTTGSTIKAAAETLYAYYGDEVAVAGVCLAHGHATPS